MIRVEIRARHSHSIHQGIAVLNELREAGIPVTGTLWPTGVECGNLVNCRDENTFSTVYIWHPPEGWQPAAKPTAIKLAEGDLW
jgi:hypothetical protein